MKKLWMVCFCILMILILGACSSGDEKHISQKDALKIAEDLVGSEVTYINMEENSENQRSYIFTDSRGNTFSVLSEGRYDGGAEFGTYYCWVTDTYQKGVLDNNKEEVIRILEKHGLAPYMENVFMYSQCVNLEVCCGTPEENREVLKKIAAAGTEIDELLDMFYDTEYQDKVKKKDYSYVRGLSTSLFIVFYKGEEKSIVNISSPDFSVSEDERWTADSLYEAMATELYAVELAE